MIRIAAQPVVALMQNKPPVSLRHTILPKVGSQRNSTISEKIRYTMSLYM
jgi:hypothetical protein